MSCIGSHYLWQNMFWVLWYSFQNLKVAKMLEQPQRRSSSFETSIYDVTPHMPRPLMTSSASLKFSPNPFRQNAQDGIARKEGFNVQTSTTIGGTNVNDDATESRDICHKLFFCLC